MFVMIEWTGGGAEVYFVSNKETFDQFNYCEKATYDEAWDWGGMIFTSTKVSPEKQNSPTRPVVDEQRVLALYEKICERDDHTFDNELYTDLRDEFLDCLIDPKSF